MTETGPSGQGLGRECLAKDTAPASAVAEMAARPSPAAALEAAFRRILREQMRGLPMVNPALAVEAVGFRPWGEHWLGVLVTPWFMNLVLMPRVAARWHAIGEREKRQHVFPAGVFEFIGARDKSLGDFQACSLFSPMFNFADHAAARATAAAALEALFDAAHRDGAQVPQKPVPQAAPGGAADTCASAPTSAALSKRDFLFGHLPRSDRGA